MNAQQFGQFMTEFGNRMQAMVNNVAAPAAAGPARINVPLLEFRGEPRENVAAWLIKVETIFQVQGIDNAANRYYYAGTGIKDAAQHWYLQRMVTHGNNARVPWATWAAFK